jgi:hypothetical protein
MARLTRKTTTEPPADAALVAADVDVEARTQPTGPPAAHDGYEPPDKPNQAAVGGEARRPETKAESRERRYRSDS